MAIAVFPLERAFAQDEAPAIDPPGHWRVMGQDDEHSTSRCIGKPDTPLCAIETLMACVVRDDNDLCKAEEGADWDGFLFGGPPPSTYKRCYRVSEVTRIVRDHQRLFRYAEGDIPIARKGDLLITVEEDDHTVDECDNTLSISLDNERFLVRKEGGRWHTVAGSSIMGAWYVW